MKAGELSAWLRVLTRRPAARDTVLLLLGFGMRMACQAAAYIVVARVLGPGPFGAFAAALAAASIVVPFVEYGAFNLAVRDIVAGAPTRRAVGIGIGLTLLAIPVGLIALALFKLVLLRDVGTVVVLGVGLGVFTGPVAVRLAGGANLAHGTPWRNAVVEGANGITLLLASAVLWATGAGLGGWLVLFVAQSALIGSAAITWCGMLWGAPRWSWGELKARFAGGFHFALNGAATTAYSDLDKTLLARWSTLDAVGVYTAAHRFLVLGAVPIAAFLNAVYSRFFTEGRDGLVGARRYAVRVLPATLAYSVIATGGMWALAPAAAWLLGSGFADASTAIRWMCIVVVLQAVQLPFAEALTGSGLQHVRTMLQVIALVVSALLNVLLVPSLGWRGAAIALLAAQGLLTLALAMRVLRGSRARNPPAA